MLASEWKISDRPERWLAIGEHDDAEIELDGENLLSSTRDLLKFSRKEFDLAHYEN